MGLAADSGSGVGAGDVFVASGAGEVLGTSAAGVLVVAVAASDVAGVVVAGVTSAAVANAAPRKTAGNRKREERGFIVVSYLEGGVGIGPDGPKERWLSGLSIGRGPGPFYSRRLDSEAVISKGGT